MRTRLLLSLLQKHDPKGEFNNYAYEIIGIGHHTEMKGNFEESAMMIYRPLYESAKVYNAGKRYDLRPLERFVKLLLGLRSQKQLFQDSKESRTSILLPELDIQKIKDVLLKKEWGNFLLIKKSFYF